MMHTGLFQKAIASILLVAFFHLSCYQTVMAVRHGIQASDDGIEEERERRASTIPYKAMENVQPSTTHGATSVNLEIGIDIEEEPTLLTLLRDDPDAVIELKKLVQGLPSTTRRELRSLADLQEYAEALGSKGTAIKWSIAVVDGALKAGGLAALFAGAPAVGGMLYAPTEVTGEVPSKLIGYSALAGGFVLPNTIGGSEDMILALRHGFTTREGDDDLRLIEYCKKKGARHIIIRGVVDGSGATVLVVLTVQAFLAAIQGAAPSTLPVLYVLGTFWSAHQAQSGLKKADESFLAAQRFVAERKAPPEVKEAREHFKTVVLDAFRKAVQEPDAARDEMHRMRTLRDTLQEVLAELDRIQGKLKGDDALFADLAEDRKDVRALEMMAELFMVGEFNKEGLYRPAPHPTKWYDYLPFSRLWEAGYSKLHRVLYGAGAGFVGGASYLFWYGYIYALPFLGAAATPIGGITAILMSMYFMDLGGKMAATIGDGYAADNTALHGDKIENTHTGSRSLWSRFARPTLSFLSWVASGFATLPETGAAAVGVGTLVGNTDADHRHQMYPIIASATGHGAEDATDSSPLHNWLSRIQEYRHGSGAQAYKDYLKRLLEGLEDLTSEEAVRMHKALEEFGTLVHRLLGEYRDKKAAGKAADLEAELRHAATAALDLAQSLVPAPGKKQEGSPPDSVVSVTGTGSTVSSDELTREIDSRRSSPDGDAPGGTDQDHSPVRLAHASREREMQEVVGDQARAAVFDSAPLGKERKKKKKHRAKVAVSDLRRPLIPAEEDEAGLVYHDALSGDEGLELTTTTSSSDGSGSDHSPPRGSPPIDAAHSTAVVPPPQAQRGSVIVPQRGAGVRAWISDKFHGLMSRVSPFGASVT